MKDLDYAAKMAITRPHVEAAIRMLLGKKALKPSLAFVGGDQLDALGRLELCRLATDSNVDLIQLEFAPEADNSYAFTGISIAVRREGVTYFFGNCQLSLPAGSRRAVIMANDARQGHFVVSPREIVHLKTKPRAALESGLEPAREKLLRLGRRGIDITAQAAVRELEEAA